MMRCKYIIFVLVISIIVCLANGHSTQMPSRDRDDDDSNPFMDMATTFLRDALSKDSNGGGGGARATNDIGGIASLIGNLMQADGAKSNNGGGLGAAQIISSIGSILANGRNSDSGGIGGLDPSIINNVIEMFASAGGSDSNNKPSPLQQRRKRSNDKGPNGFGLDSIINIASAFLSNSNEADSPPSTTNGANDGLMSLLPMVVQTVNSFIGPEGDRIHAKHKDHAYVLPPILEKIHVMWDHFSNSELADALYVKSGINLIFKGFTGRDGKLDYDRLFNSLHNQSFRRRWIKAATLYMSDWANYLAEPDVYKRYFGTAQMMFNGFLQSQGIPKHALFDLHRPSETVSNLLDHVVRYQLNTKISSIVYVKPGVEYVRDIFRLGKARGLLQKFNATELSDKLTDTVNLEVIEPVLRVHRAYGFTTRSPHCDKYVLCEINSHDPNEKLGLAGFKAGITKFGSWAAAWFIANETGTPFWTLFSVVNEPYHCQKRYPADCWAFHEDEAKTKTDYIHNEL